MAAGAEELRAGLQPGSADGVLGDRVVAELGAGAPGVARQGVLA